ncbi:Transcription factor [Malassezia cuniculi]|uniref:Transcription factor n=1 Tax=Malassezia cuniculi TaxID=948313 RepID=A0AAF0EYU3_9BASI|nr:Transcription factor [Malassezia cuniculi]
MTESMANIMNQVTVPMTTASSEASSYFSVVDVDPVTSMATSHSLPAMSFGGQIITPVTAQFAPSLLTSNAGRDTNYQLSQAQDNKPDQNMIPPKGIGGSRQRGIGEIGAASGLYMLSKANSEHSEEEGKPEKNSSKSAQKSNHDADNSDGNDIESLKRRNFLERNRQAALKCRQRKKAWLASLQAKVEYLQSDNESLQNTVEMLRSEVLLLKSVNNIIRKDNNRKDNNIPRVNRKAGHSTSMAPKVK